MKKSSHQRSMLKKALAGKVSAKSAHRLLEKEPEPPEVSVWLIQPDGSAIEYGGTRVKTKEQMQEEERDPLVQVITIGRKKQ
jgi:hypothetical protein